MSQGEVDEDDKYTRFLYGNSQFLRTRSFFRNVRCVKGSPLRRPCQGSPANKRGICMIPSHFLLLSFFLDLDGPTTKRRR